MKKAFKTSLIVCFMLLLLPISLSFLSPSNIVLRSGDKISLFLGLPLKGSIAGDNSPVAAIGDVPVTENITLDMNKPVPLKGIKSGNVDLMLSFVGIPVKKSTITVLPDEEVIPLGRAVAMELETDGVLVLGTGEVHTKSGKYISPCASILKSGDLIKKVDSKTLTDKESLISAVEDSSNNNVVLTIERNGEIMQKEVTPAESIESNSKKLGVWVRDSTKGIGTLTCCLKDGRYYALGHPVTDVDTGTLMKTKSGSVFTTSIVSVNKGKKGSPGELVGNSEAKEKIGSVSENTPCGIKGKLSTIPKSIKPCKIALKSEVKEGKAYILVNTEDNKVLPYSINIESVDTLSTDKSKGMILYITDKRLIEKTGGIVQGMSGAPIMQDGKLVGAVTHVFIQNPTKGYGIFIEDMLK